MQVALTMTVEVPQLERLCTILEQLGGRLMADIQGLHDIVSLINTTFDQHLTEIEALLSGDALDQQQIDAAVAQLRTFQEKLASAIPDVPPPPPAPPTP